MAARRVRFIRFSLLARVAGPAGLLLLGVFMIWHACLVSRFYSEREVSDCERACFDQFGGSDYLCLSRCCASGAGC